MSCWTRQPICSGDAADQFVCGATPFRLPQLLWTPQRVDSRRQYLSSSVIAILLRQPAADASQEVCRRGSAVQTVVVVGGAPYFQRRWCPNEFWSAQSAGSISPRIGSAARAERLASALHDLAEAAHSSCSTLDTNGQGYNGMCRQLIEGMACFAARQGIVNVFLLNTVHFGVRDTQRVSFACAGGMAQRRSP
jgi:hypothetical protein